MMYLMYRSFEVNACVAANCDGVVNRAFARQKKFT